MSGADDALILAIYACATSDAAIHDCLRLLSDQFGGRSAALIYQDPVRASADFGFGYGLLDAAAQARYRAEFARYDPAPAAMAKLALGAVTTTGRLFDSEDPRHAHFLRNFYYPLGLREAIGGPVAREAGQSGIIAVQRGPDRGPFDAGDIAAFERLMPHVIRAIGLRRAFFELQSEAEDLRAAVEPVGPGILVLEPDGPLRHANVAARTILNRRDGFLLDASGFVHVLTDPEARRFARLDQRRPGFSMVPRVQDAHDMLDLLPYALRLSRRHEPGGGAAPSLIVRIHDPDRRWHAAECTLLEAFPMSRHAARLTIALTTGDDLAVYAHREGISLNTAKFHLKAAFAATQTKRQPDLVRRALGVVGDLSDT
ncbi:helix-turn-helix transcriptional regulator [Methylobacterium sp. A54F]